MKKSAPQKVLCQIDVTVTALDVGQIWFYVDNPKIFLLKRNV